MSLFKELQKKFGKYKVWIPDPQKNKKIEYESEWIKAHSHKGALSAWIVGNSPRSIWKTQDTVTYHDKEWFEPQRKLLYKEIIESDDWYAGGD